MQERIRGQIDQRGARTYAVVDGRAVIVVVECDGIGLTVGSTLTTRQAIYLAWRLVATALAAMMRAWRR